MEKRHIVEIALGIIFIALFFWAFSYFAGHLKEFSPKEQGPSPKPEPGEYQRRLPILPPEEVPAGSKGQGQGEYRRPAPLLPPEAAPAGSGGQEQPASPERPAQSGSSEDWGVAKAIQVAMEGGGYGLPALAKGIEVRA